MDDAVHRRRIYTFKALLSFYLVLSIMNRLKNHVGILHRTFIREPLYLVQESSPAFRLAIHVSTFGVGAFSPYASIYTCLRGLYLMLSTSSHFQRCFRPRLNLPVSYSKGLFGIGLTTPLAFSQSCRVHSHLANTLFLCGSTTPSLTQTP